MNGYDNANVVPIVQAGENKKITRTLLLRAGIGEDILLIGDGGNNNVKCTTGGSIELNSAPAQGIYLNAGASSIIEMNGAGAITINTAVGESFAVHCNSASIVIDDSGAVTISGSVSGSSISIDASGAITITPASGQSVTIGGSIYQDATNADNIQSGTLPAARLPTLPYSPANAGNWVGSPPDFVPEALDRLALACVNAGQTP